MTKIFLFVLVLACLCGIEVFASGFDKPVLWSGRYGGMGGASVSMVEGPESLAFNPAGLATQSDSEISLAVSPFITQRECPVVTDRWSKTGVVFPGGVLYSRQVQKGLGVGAGVFASGGGANDLGNVDFGSLFPTLHPAMDTKFQFLEFSLGAGYELAPGIRLGLAWRMMMAQADLHVAVPVYSAASGGTDTLYAYSFEKLSGTYFGAFRLGAQYEPESKKWGAGASLRSSVPLHITGNSSGQSQDSGSSTINSLTGGKIGLETSYPWQLAVGVHYAATDQWKLIAEYDFTHYAAVDRFIYSGDPVGGVDPANFTVQTNWMNLSSVRLGTEYAIPSDDLVLRAGFIFQSQVTPTDRASFITLPPGTGQGYTFGIGKHAMDNRLALDLALDYSRISGDAKNSQPGFTDGHYAGYAATLHTSATYHF